MVVMLRKVFRGLRLYGAGTSNELSSNDTEVYFLDGTCVSDTPSSVE